MHSSDHVTAGHGYFGIPCPRIEICFSTSEVEYPKLWPDSFLQVRALSCQEGVCERNSFFYFFFCENLRVFGPAPGQVREVADLPQRGASDESGLVKSMCECLCVRTVCVNSFHYVCLH